MVALDNEESSFGFGFDSSKDSSEDEDFHWIIVNEERIKVRYDTIWPADTFYFSHDLEFKWTWRNSEKWEEEDVENVSNVDSNLVKDNIEREEQRLAELKKLNYTKDLFKNEIKKYENYISENKDYIKTNYIKYDVSIVDDITDINEIILHSQELNNELDKIKSEVVKNQNIETDAAFDKVERENQDIFDKSDKLVVEKEAKFEAEENKSVLEKTGDSIWEVFEDTGEYISEKYEQIKAWIEELFADNEELNSFVAENGETITVEYNPSSNAIEVNTTWFDSIADYDLWNVPSDIASLEEAKAYVQEKLAEIKADYDKRVVESQVSEEPEEETHYYNTKHNWNNESWTKSQQEIAELNTDENIDDEVEKKYELNTIDIDENTLNQVKNIWEWEWSEIKVWEYKDKDWNVKDVVVKWGKDNIIDPVLELDGSATWSDIDVDLWEIKTMEDLNKKFEELMKKYNEDK
jgi:chorismate mutase